jgi:FkbM family methyltransferase
VIETASARLSAASRVCRLFPPAMSGRLMRRLYPRDLGQREQAAFVASSSLGPVRFRLTTDDYIATAFALRGFFEWRNVLIANALCRRGDLILDIGANIGTETLLFSKIVGRSGRVIAFEPLPRNFAILEGLVRENRLGNVEVRREAVSDRSGVLRFEAPAAAGNYGVGRIAHGDAPRQGQGQIEVSSVVLDERFGPGDLPGLRLVVMDVEGFEPDVLRGARRLIASLRPFLILEVGQALLERRQLRPAGVLDLVTTLGYAAYEIGAWGLAPASGQGKGTVNWLCIPADADHRRIARGLTRRIRLGAFLPLVRGLNPAVVDGDE